MIGGRSLHVRDRSTVTGHQPRGCRQGAEDEGVGACAIGTFRPMTDIQEPQPQDRPTAVAASGDARLSSPRTDPAVEHDRALSRERDRFSGMHFGLGFFGWLTATGMTVLLLAVVATIAGLAGMQNATGSSVGTLGVGGAIALGVILLIAYFCGGYVAGRMARFSGLKQGLAVWLWAIIVAIVLGITGAVVSSTSGVTGQLGSVAQLPFSPSQLTLAGVAGAIAVLVITLVGALLGGLAGMRYHRKVDRVGGIVTEAERASR